MSLGSGEHELFRSAMISSAADSQAVAYYVRLEEAAVDNPEINMGGCYESTLRGLSDYYGLDSRGTYEAIALHYERNDPFRDLEMDGG